MTVPIHPPRDLRLPTLPLVLLVALAGIAGCGNDDSPDVMVSPPGWVVAPSGGQHATSATLTYIANGGTSSCAECHGADLSGGTSKVSCFGNPAGCHHGPVAGWVAAPPAAQSHGVAAKKAPGNSGFASCQVCHGADFRTPRGDANRTCYSCHSLAPHPNGPWRSSAGSTHTNSDPSNASVCANCHRNANPGTPDCFNNTLCHGATGPGTVSHAVPFPGAPHTTTDPANFATSCSTCHAVTGVSPSSAAPLCAVCHPSAAALPFTNCTSCHTRPPSGTAYPNVAGSHAGHDALANVTGVCASCHDGLGSGTAGHYDRANARPGKDALRVPPGEAAFLSVYNAKAGPAAFDNATLACANVSCHGGVTAPNWRTGSINGNTDSGCRQCHRIGAAAGNPENNSPFSGLHAAHLSTTVGGAILCTDCHNMSNGTAGALNHYKFLNTPQMEGPAGDTVAPNGSAANYVDANQTCGTFTCHTIVHVNFSWSGGASHTVPFTGANHTSVTSSNFAANCGACHSETGPAAKLGPTCTVCHQTGSPLAAADCTSCHGDPPSGTAYPNVAGKHAVHDALPGVGVCNPCHNGLDTGTLEHYNRANARPGKDALRMPPGEAAFLSVYNAKAGPAAFDNATLACANVSCHGGVTAPNWRTGSIDGNTDSGCRQCHRIGAAAGNPESNSPFSGRHAVHLSTTVGGAILCTDCHNMSNGTAGALNHYKFLNTPQMEGPAGDTVAPNGSAANYAAANQTCGNFICHTIVHFTFVINYSWSGGASRTVPFTGVNHTP